MNKACMPPKEKIWWLEMADFLEVLAEVDDCDMPPGGICLALKEHAAFSVVGTEAFFQNHDWLAWDGHSGCNVFPVGNGILDYIFCDGGCYWLGDYGELRRDLCQHLADSIREMLP